MNESSLPGCKTAFRKMGVHRAPALSEQSRPALLKQLPPKNITARMLLHFLKVSVYIWEFFHAQVEAAAPPSLLACLFV